MEPGGHVLGRGAWGHGGDPRRGLGEAGDQRRERRGPGPPGGLQGHGEAPKIGWRATSRRKEVLATLIPFGRMLTEGLPPQEKHIDSAVLHRVDRSADACGDPGHHPGQAPRDRALLRRRDLGRDPAKDGGSDRGIPSRAGSAPQVHPAAGRGLRLLRDPHSTPECGRPSRPVGGPRRHHRPTEAPRGVYFFGGPTGVGKTHTALLLAEVLGGGRASLVRVDCNTLHASGGDAGQALSVLLGPLPGYVGYVRGKGGVLSRDPPGALEEERRDRLDGHDRRRCSRTDGRHPGDQPRLIP